MKMTPEERREALIFLVGNAPTWTDAERERLRSKEHNRMREDPSRRYCCPLDVELDVERRFEFAETVLAELLRREEEQKGAEA